MSRLASRVVAALGLAGLLPSPAGACPACFAASDARVADMYLLTAALLSVLPFAIVAAVAWWCWRHAGGSGA